MRLRDRDSVAGLEIVVRTQLRLKLILRRRLNQIDLAIVSLGGFQGDERLRVGRPENAVLVAVGFVAILGQREFFLGFPVLQHQVVVSYGHPPAVVGRMLASRRTARRLSKTSKPPAHAARTRSRSRREPVGRLEFARRGIKSPRFIGDFKPNRAGLLDFNAIERKMPRVGRDPRVLFEGRGEILVIECRCLDGFLGVDQDKFQAAREHLAIPKTLAVGEPVRRDPRIPNLSQRGDREGCRPGIILLGALCPKFRR